MLLDFEIQRCTRQCAATERKLAPGESFYSVLVVDGADVIRRDYCQEAWDGPPESAFGWWQSRVPQVESKKAKLAPNDVLLELFDQLAEQPEREDVRYVLLLLLVRRRVMRLEESVAAAVADSPATTLVAYCPRRDESYKVSVVKPDDDRIDAIQQELAHLLYADAA